MRNYVEHTWGWDEVVQHHFFKDKFVPDDYFVVMKSGERLGCLQFSWHINDLRVHTIEIAPGNQNQGLGTSILTHLQDKAFERRRDVSLRVLKCNPASHLFLRLGFVQAFETDTHVSLIWKHRSRLSL